MAPKKEKKTVCLFCLNSFPDDDLFVLRISSTCGPNYRTSCCVKCVKKDDTLKRSIGVISFPKGLEEDQLDLYRKMFKSE